MKLIKIPDMCKLNINIPKEKFITDKNNEVYGNIDKIILSGNIKPGISNTSATITDTLRYEEIQFFEVVLKSRADIYKVGNIIYSAVKYPCITEFVIDDVVIIGACEFQKGKINSSDNVKKKIRFSHILRQELMSHSAQEMIDNINEIINSEESVGYIYNKVCNEIMNYGLSGISRNHVKKLITDMIGEQTFKERQFIMRYGEEYECYKPSSKYERYSKKKPCSRCSPVYDYEEIWFCFMKYPPIKNVIEKRRYNGMVELIYYIDSKSWCDDGKELSYV